MSPLAGRSARTGAAHPPIWRRGAHATDHENPPMKLLLVHLGPLPQPAPCACCAGECRRAGPLLVQADDLRPICERCARGRAPGLLALVRLADEATRVAKIGRHTVAPPYVALLDLARAAEA